MIFQTDPLDPEMGNQTNPIILSGPGSNGKEVGALHTADI